MANRTPDRRRKWSSQEEQLLCKLWHTLGFGSKVEAGMRLPWKEMLDHAHISEPGVFDACREPAHLKDKARNLGLLGRDELATTTPVQQALRSTPGAGDPI